MTYQQPIPPQQPAPPPGQVVHPGAYGQAYTTTYVMRPSGPKGMSITSMVLGIVSFFFGWTFLVPIAGLIFGIVGIRKEPDGKGFSITGIILNALMLLAWGIGTIVTLLTIGLAFLPFLAVLGSGGY